MLHRPDQVYKAVIKAQRAPWRALVRRSAAPPGTKDARRQLPIYACFSRTRVWNGDDKRAHARTRRGAHSATAHTAQHVHARAPRPHTHKHTHTQTNKQSINYARAHTQVPVPAALLWAGGGGGGRQAVHVEEGVVLPRQQARGPAHRNAACRAVSPRMSMMRIESGVRSRRIMRIEGKEASPAGTRRRVHGPNAPGALTRRVMRWSLVCCVGIEPLRPGRAASRLRVCDLLSCARLRARTHTHTYVFDCNR